MSVASGSIGRTIAAGALAIAAASCTTVGPDYEPPRVESGPGWVGDADMTASEESFIAWWRDLGDPELVRLVEKSLGSNLTIRQSLERVAEARARRASTRSGLFPSARAEASANVQRQSENANPAIGNIPGLERNQELYDLGVGGDWQVDLFGQTRRAVEAGDARIESAVAAANAARLMIVTEVARTYLSLGGYQAERRALEAALEAQRRTLRLVRVQLANGEVSRAAEVQAETEMARIASEVPPVEAEIRAAAFALSVLTGELPETEFELARFSRSLIGLAMIPVGERADLLRRRPDIAIAERNLAAETAEIGVATAELFPKLSISAGGGFRSLALDTLVSEDSTRFSIIPFLSWRIFDGGRVRAEIRLAEAEARRAALAYEEAVIDALGEAETALARYELSLRTKALAADAARLAAENLRLARIQYREGAVDLLRVLDAQRAYRDALRGEAAAYRRAALGLVQLYAALGGGWQNPELLEEPSS